MGLQLETNFIQLKVHQTKPTIFYSFPVVHYTIQAILCILAIQLIDR